MRVKKVSGRYLLRLERGEEVMESLKAFVVREALPGGTIAGLGAADEMTVAFYDLAAKEYRPYLHAGRIEILSIAGNVAWRASEPVVHVHVTAAEEKKGVFGGHLVSARVAATVEIDVDPRAERIERKLDPEIGLPLLDLPPYDPKSR
jgi:predicted DNA-binding protein with PD1-like motif